MDLLNSEVKSKQQCYTEEQMELYDTGNSQDGALVFSKLLLVLGSPLGDSWRAPRVPQLWGQLRQLCSVLKQFTWFGEDFRPLHPAL